MRADRTALRVPKLLFAGTALYWNRSGLWPVKLAEGFHRSGGVSVMIMMMLIC